MQNRQYSKSATRRTLYNHTLSGLRIVVIALLLGACRTHPGPATILLFSGAGTSPNDVTAFENILHEEHLDYATANSAQLNRMTSADLERYRLLIVPGGNFVDMGNSLTGETVLKIRNAIAGGLNYHGICAGAFIAGNSPFHGLNLTEGVTFRFYSAEARGTRKAAVPITLADGATFDHYWEDGPQLSGWGTSVARYPDGTPAVAEGSLGKGWIVLSGIHAEAPENWRRGMTFATPASRDKAYAVTLIRAALNRTSLLVR